MDSKNDLCIAGADMSAFSTITLSTDIGDIVINVNNGNVEYPDDLPAAAKKFWTALEEAFQFRNVGGHCKDCSHWQDAGGCGVCDLFSGDIEGRLSTDWGPITTKPDFGCVEWEAMEET